jgi:hypothetical protein
MPNTTPESGFEDLVIDITGVDFGGTSPRVEHLILVPRTDDYVDFRERITPTLTRSAPRKSVPRSVKPDTFR